MACKGQSTPVKVHGLQRPISICKGAWFGLAQANRRLQRCIARKGHRLQRRMACQGPSTPAKVHGLQSLSLGQSTLAKAHVVFLQRPTDVCKVAMVCMACMVAWLAWLTKVSAYPAGKSTAARDRDHLAQKHGQHDPCPADIISSDWGGLFGGHCQHSWLESIARRESTARRDSIARRTMPCQSNIPFGPSRLSPFPSLPPPSPPSSPSFFSFLFPDRTGHVG